MKNNRNHNILLFLCSLLLLVFHLTGLRSLVSGQEPVESVFHTSRSNPSGWQAYIGPVNSVYRQIAAEAIQLLDKREQKIDSLKTESDWMNYTKNLRFNLYAGMKEFKRAPLNPKTTGSVEKKDYTIEKILFESFPRFYVTGCLFLPRERQKPAPAVIYCSGHSVEGFRTETYLRVILNLVYKGFIVFAFDPVGQGERLQYPDVNGKSSIGEPTSEHAYAGIQTLLTGHSLSDFFIWDGVRAVDFLLSRPEVDASRIGITGRSGGGTQSAMIAAYDERIFAAAPECYITSFRRLLESMGPQDAEQNPYQAIKRGFDHADFFHLRAPKPSLIVTTTNDIFSIQGAREVYKEAKKSYLAFGKPENLSMTEDYGVHESTLKNRETVYAFFLRTLNLPGNAAEITVKFPDMTDLLVTTDGRVVSSCASLTVSDLNRNYLPVISNSVPSQEEVTSKIRGTIAEESDIKASDNVYTGRIKKEDFYIDKYFIHRENCKYAVPYYFGKSPISDNKKMIVLLSPQGKNTLISREILIGKLARLGFLVLSPDLPGTGELALTDYKGDSYVKGKSYNHFFGANLIGKSISEMQASDLGTIISEIQSDLHIRNIDITLIAENEMSISALFWAVLNKNLNQIILLQPLVSFRTLAENKSYSPDYMMASVPGLLKTCDLPEIEASLAPGSVTFINPVDGAFKPVTDTKLFSKIREAYRIKKSADKFQVLQLNENEIWDYIYQKIANSQ